MNVRLRLKQIDPANATTGSVMVFSPSTNISGSWITGSLSDISGTLTSSQHAPIRQLIHFIDDGPAEGFASGAFKETHNSFFPTASIWYTDSSKADKIVEKTINRSAPSGSNLKPNPITWKMYDVDGSTVLVTVQDDITYSGIKEVSRTRIIT